MEEVPPLGRLVLIQLDTEPEMSSGGFEPLLPFVFTHLAPIQVHHGAPICAHWAADDEYWFVPLDLSHCSVTHFFLREVPGTAVRVFCGEVKAPTGS